MPVTITPVSTPFATKIVKDLDSDATGENNVLGGAGTVHLVRVDNTGNGAAVYTKLYDHVSPVIGTTDPDFVLRTPASAIREFVLGSPASGIAFSVGLSFATTTTGGTGGTTSPTNDVGVQILVA